VIYELVQKRELYSIHQYAVSLEQSHPQWQPFTPKLAALAKNFQDEAIQHLII
jgi:hypothetical protein